jgi:hypothetical protein
VRKRQAEGKKAQMQNVRVIITIITDNTRRLLQLFIKIMPSIICVYPAAVALYA